MMNWETGNNRIHIVRPANAQQTGPNVNKRITTIRGVSRAVIEASRLTLVDITNKKKALQNEKALLGLE